MSEMNDIKEILKENAEKYPLLRPEDAIKLIYQATFGGGHMVSDKEAVISRLKKEHDTASVSYPKYYTETLGETARIYISPEMSDAELSVIAGIFTASAENFAKGFEEASPKIRQTFEEHISALNDLCKEGIFSFTHDELNKHLTEYRADGYPAISHSDAYRNAYTPAYRVIDSRYVRLLPVMFEAAKRIYDGKHTVLAIDGRAASGKTTAAQLISKVLPSETVHMDHFFLPRELRTAERLSEVGGNIHRERFIEEVLPSLKNGNGFSYRVFDCSAFDFSDKLWEIRPAPLYIVEGSYALHPSFGKYYDLWYFSDVSADEQLRRILKRNGEKMLARFVDEWIPMEERYFESIGMGR